MNLYLNFASFVGVAVLLMAVGIILFILSTPKLKEFGLIAEKNATAAMSLGGRTVASRVGGGMQTCTN